MTIDPFNAYQFNNSSFPAEMHQPAGLVTKGMYFKFQKCAEELKNIFKVTKRMEESKKAILEIDTKMNSKRLDHLRKTSNKEILRQPDPKGIKMGETVFFSPFENSYKEFTQLNKFLKDNWQTEFEKSILKKNSLFLSREFSKKDKLEILKIAGDPEKALREDPERFVGSKIGICNPIFDKRLSVIYKPNKNADIFLNSIIVRDAIERKKLNRLILPAREIWRQKGLTPNPKKDKTKSMSVIIEDVSLNVLRFAGACLAYKNHPELFTPAIQEITALLCEVDIGDLCFTDRNYQISIQNASKDLYYEGCKCNFSNLCVKPPINSKDGPFYSFVLVDLDIVKEPSVSTINNLLRMFPQHMNIILDIVYDIRPDLAMKLNLDHFPETIETVRNPIKHTEGELQDNFKHNRKVRNHCLETERKEQLKRLESNGTMSKYRGLISELDNRVKKQSLRDGILSFDCEDEELFGDSKEKIDYQGNDLYDDFNVGLDDHTKDRSRKEKIDYQGNDLCYNPDVTPDTYIKDAEGTITYNYNDLDSLLQEPSFLNDSLYDDFNVRPDTNTYY